MDAFSRYGVRSTKLNFSPDNAFFKAGMMPHKSTALWAHAVSDTESWLWRHLDRLGSSSDGQSQPPSKLQYIGCLYFSHLLKSRYFCAHILKRNRRHRATGQFRDSGPLTPNPKCLLSCYPTQLSTTCLCLGLETYSFSSLLINDQAVSVRCTDNFIYLRMAVARLKR